MAEVIDITKHPAFNKRKSSLADIWEHTSISEPIDLDSIEPEHFITVSTTSTDDLIQELLVVSATGRGIREIPKGLIILELAARLESYADILSEVLAKSDTRE